ncbi:MAG: hypothetical protein K6G81_00250 [Lachnospiraceae bacterium]|nr:hypothetical protein [Lachnospiraceae bacterium]
MSNLIKASSITYSNDVRTLDMNKRADEFQELFANEFYKTNVIPQHELDFEGLSKRLEDEKVLTADDVDFTPGLILDNPKRDELDREKFETEAATLEARLAEKRQEISELEARIKEASNEAQRIVDEAGEQAENIINEAIQKAGMKTDSIRDEARQQGLSEGLAAAENEVARIRAEVEQTREQYRMEYLKQVEEIEPAFVELVVKYVEKLTGVYNADKDEIILHLIDDAFKGIKGTQNFIIRVSTEDLPTVSASKEALREMISADSTLEIVEDRLLQKSQCMIETESRIYDCSLDGQLHSLIEDIKLLAEKD